MNSVTVLTVTYGKRSAYLKQVIDAVIDDEHLYKVIIVDNCSSDKEEIDSLVTRYQDKIELIRHDYNLGSAGGFASGFERARTHDVQHVFVLDDDNVPEKGAIGMFLKTLETFPDKKVVLCGNRLNLPGNTEFFYRKPLKNAMPRGTFFEVLSLAKVQHFFNLAFSPDTTHAKREAFVPVIPNESFVYGGTFLPIEAVRESPLPDSSLVLYGDDIEYSWNIKRRGYQSYVCEKPHIYDIDYSFTEGTHITGLFYASTKPFKVYYKIRNMVLLSVRHSQQGKFELLLNIIFWITGLLFLGVLKTGPTITYCKRVKLILTAVYIGYHPHSTIARTTEALFPEVGQSATKKN